MLRTPARTLYGHPDGIPVKEGTESFQEGPEGGFFCATFPHFPSVIPAKAGIQGHMRRSMPLALNPRFRGDDDRRIGMTDWNEKGPAKPALGSSDYGSGLLLDAEILEPLLELGELTAAVQQAVDAGPGGMRLGVDFQIEGVAGLAPGGASRECRPVGHHDVDLMVVGVDLLFHGLAPVKAGAYSGGVSPWQDPSGSLPPPAAARRRRPARRRDRRWPPPRSRPSARRARRSAGRRQSRSPKTAR